METCCYAIVPDGAAFPTAIFQDLDDAMIWALEKYGGDRFAIREAKDMIPNDHRWLAA